MLSTYFLKFYNGLLNIESVLLPLNSYITHSVGKIDLINSNL